ncbi:MULTISPECIES: pyrroline-5-carboxylate reductase [Olivibacter]|jgi:pyrroline-5-carboxylate reductase|uniref:Pyrroline-5-carboxylate reductase n=3 Tax=Sphingobacteriaceae TaxID=84566 RepID=F4CCS4_SPHS2|nr:MULTISPECIES: pyrroline-5-carboxylate reductase [Olivibacter]MCL4642156.1 pyrroline-5-carboxylate reductase [Olivibacter sp. UJ_SKK_5.1]MDM8177677.1 pyrroline-5-carboxylate reductase [Olivibacter sp. 47]MDX3911903.1 pyrroline-5-carboxylate reductase [Pseudosphingobacterium sp.]QEK99650.1 pyrroline-5-carboxylate reductase [Olivibacter sp. LS-1]
MPKITIIGSGNIGLSLAKGLIAKAYCNASDITLTRRNIRNMSQEAKLGFKLSDNNREAVLDANIIVLAVLPQQLNQVLEQINGAVIADKQLVVSVISGVSCRDIRHKLGDAVQVIRAMPNTAIAIGQSMTCIASDNAHEQHMDEVTRLFETVGAVVTINEDLMTSATALCACGIAFFLRSIRAASQGGVEIGFHAHDALKMAVQTAKGAADLLLQMQSHPESEIDKVTSPKGCTIAGLNEMEHNGFSSAFIKGIKLSAERAGGLYKE